MRGGALFKGKKGRGDFRRILIDFIKVANNIVVINDLPHSNPFIEEMVIQMAQLINYIECHRWYSTISPAPSGSLTTFEHCKSAFRLNHFCNLA